jgi:hypothetical protein
MTNVILHKEASPESTPIAHTELKQKPEDVITPSVVEIYPGQSMPVILFNPLAYERNHVAHLIVNTPNVQVVDAEGRKVECQINPVWKSNTEIATDRYELYFMASIPPLGFETYFVEHSTEMPEVPDILVWTGVRSETSTSDFLGKSIFIIFSKYIRLVYSVRDYI